MDQRHLIISYLTLRRFIGVIAVLQPGLLYLGGALLFSLPLQPSMSDYYYTGMRDVFVGVDFLIGGFLLCYKGYDVEDRIVALVAGTAAIVVALFPIPSPTEGILTTFSTNALNASILANTAIIHAAAATVFMLALTYFCLVLFVKNDETVVVTREKILRNLVYRLCGINIILAMLAVLAFYALSPIKQTFLDTPYIFWCEAFAFVSFGVAWLVKGRALLADTSDD